MSEGGGCDARRGEMEEGSRGGGGIQWYWRAEDELELSVAKWPEAECFKFIMCSRVQPVEEVSGWRLG